MISDTKILILILLLTVLILKRLERLFKPLLGPKKSQKIVLVVTLVPS